ncbi:winged helix-turn-helix domain-containing protein [Tsuneonella sp. SYSU-LHT278]|uniref:winged helix-turn-helix domain-containing protein n=1 Tax=Tsuneonella sediminis TaxID=3416089 RepID=UPI003F7B1656
MRQEHCDEFVRLDATESFRLGAVRVEPGTRRILHGNEELLLEPRVMRVLVALAQANGEVVGHDTLIRRCWDGQVVGDNAIQRAVSKVRQAGIGFGSGAFDVQTVRGVGYRLRSAEHGDRPDERRLQPRFDRRIAVAAVAGAVLAGGAAFLRSRADEVDPRALELFERAEVARRDEGCALVPGQAPSLFRSAIDIAPQYGAPWGGLALVSAKALDWNDDNQRNLRGTLAAARRGAELDPAHPYPRIALALAEPTYKRWRVQRERLEQLEARLSPGWDLPAAIGFLALCCGEFDVSIAALRRALDRQWNLAGVQFWLGHALVMAGREDESIGVAKEALAHSPNNWCAWETAFRTNLMSGKFQAATSLVADADAAPVNIRPQGRVARLMLSRAVGEGDAASRKKCLDYYRESIAQWPSSIPLAAAPLALLREFDLLTTAITGYLLSEGPMAVPTDWRRHPWFLYQPPLLELHDHPPVRRAMLKLGLEPRR